jgi:hypothetical protein
MLLLGIILFLWAIKSIIMNRKTRSMTKGIAVVIAGIGALLEMGILNIPAMAVYSFWILLMAFGLVLLVSR